MQAKLKINEFRSFNKLSLFWRTSFVLTTILSSLGFAEESGLFSRFPVPRSEVYAFKNSAGKNSRIRMAYEYNRNGELAVSAFLVEAHWLAKDTELPVLAGRDLDGDNKIETWFYSEGPIIKSFQQASTSENAWNTASQILTKLDMSDGRWIGSLIAQEMLAGLSFALDGEAKDTESLAQNQMDLQDLEYRIKSLKAENPDPALLQELQRVSNEGWDQLLERWNKSHIEDRHKRLLTDLGLLFGGGIALRGVRFLLSKAISKQESLLISKKVEETLTQSQIAKQSWLQKANAKLGGLVKKPTVNGFTSATLGAGKRFASEVEAISWLSRYSVFSNTLKKIGGIAGAVLKASWSERYYIAAAQTMQVAVESYNRGYWKFSDAPVILKEPVKSAKQFISNVSSDEGLKQNVGYMTLQTTLLSGATSLLTNNGASMAMKYAVSSLITIVDSTAINVFVLKKPDLTRIGFDTSWELLIGSTQVLLDLKLVRWGETLVHKYNRPGLKLVGYMLATLDQTAGYALYNYATDDSVDKPLYKSGIDWVADKLSFSKHEAAPADQAVRPSNVDEQIRRLNETAPVIIVPVFAPQG